MTPFWAGFLLTTCIIWCAGWASYIHRNTSLKYAICFATGSVCLGFFALFILYGGGYKDGQVDFLRGKIYYEQQINQDTTFIKKEKP
jgi:hypothetical protein